MEIQREDGKYRTSDLYFAAYLKVAGVKLIETANDKGRVIFIFELGDGLRDLRNQYFNRIAKVPALTYADEIRSMKSMVHLGNG
jgi:hypothetical protein